ncbi:hypothetical protein JL101_026240 [Skermanella rosea]|uniref:hypothetical protein n=1 Tax=Skermanella rosea TaxID=1817965 RepID=UPI001933631E|nr:hypothetical protein [Skermanella rosea]UEM03422.1 hypothetical protein JL101_026240 [Skermanella rosea]
MGTRIRQKLHSYPAQNGEGQSGRGPVAYRAAWCIGAFFGMSLKGTGTSAFSKGGR